MSPSTRNHRRCFLLLPALMDRYCAVWKRLSEEDAEAYGDDVDMIVGKSKVGGCWPCEVTEVHPSELRFDHTPYHTVYTRH